jgi:hypothetical protein
MDINYLKVLEMASEKYAYLLGDDDQLTPAALKDILKSLQNEKPDLCVLSNNTKKYYEPFTFFKDCGMPGLGGMQLSEYIMNLEKIKEYNILQGVDRYIGTKHSYAGVILDYIMEEYKQNNVINITSLPKEKIVEISTEFKSKSWRNDLFDIFLNDIPKWYEQLKPEYKENVLVQETYKYFTDSTQDLHFIGGNIQKSLRRIKNMRVKILCAKILLKLRNLKQCIYKKNKIGNIRNIYILMGLIKFKYEK